MIISIIQARLGSTRLPNKVMKKLEGKTVLEHVVSRVRRSKIIDEVFIATTIEQNNLPLIKYCASKRFRIFCGSEEDVLDRFYQLTRLIRPDHIVRITSDCPMIDPEIIDMIIESHLKSNSDYTSNTLIDSYPDGLDVEIFSFQALERAWKEASLKSEREHVTPYIKKHPELFTLNSIVSEINYSEKRWTLDTIADFKFINTVFTFLYRKNNFFGMNELLQLLRDKPDLEKINSNIIRNEGYLISVKEDKQINSF